MSEIALHIARHLPAAQRGDRRAFAELVRATQSTVSAIALAVVRDVQHSEDIAQEAYLELDMRSESPQALAELVIQAQAVTARHQQAVATEPDVRIEMTVIGDRPAGEIPKDHFLVQAAGRALAAAGVTANADMRISSTDANIPLSQGIPAICVGVTLGGDAHRTSEWITPDPLGRGSAHLLILTWWAAEWLGNGQA